MEPAPAQNISTQHGPLPAATWTRWRRRAPLFAAIIVVLGLVSWKTIPRLPPGICFDDWGDLQLASATLGIAHPPGYAGYASVGYLLTRIPGVDPAYVITIACFLSGLSVLVACLMLQARFGVNTWIAVLFTLALAAHPRFWLNIWAPEVYMPTLALLVWSVMLLLRYHDTGLRRYVVASVFCFGFAMGNRPPIVLAAPFFLFAWACASRPWVGDYRKYFRDLAWMVPLVLAPTAYSAVFIYARDRTDVCYNYIDVHNEEVMTLPESSEGVEAKLKRVAWEMTGKQFKRFMGTDWPTFVVKLRWLRTQIVYENPFTDLFVLLLMTFGLTPPTGEWYGHIDVYMISLLGLIGLWFAMRRSRVGGWLLLGLVIHSLVFVLAYQVFGQSADLLPVIFSLAIALGLVSAKIIPPRGHWIQQTIGGIAAVAACVLFAWHTPAQRQRIDAQQFVRDFDVATFPGPAVICGKWTTTTPMHYAHCVLSPRNDLHIVTSGPELWITMATKIKDRPVYVAVTPDSGGRCTSQPFRNVFLLTCPDAKDVATSKPWEGEARVADPPQAGRAALLPLPLGEGRGEGQSGPRP